MTTKSQNDTAQAIQALRAGRCAECQQTRKEKTTQTSAGFGQGMKPETIFVCGNPDCPKFGKS